MLTEHIMHFKRPIFHPRDKKRFFWNRNFTRPKASSCRCSIHELHTALCALLCDRSRSRDRCYAGTSTSTRWRGLDPQPAADAIASQTAWGRRQRHPYLRDREVCGGGSSPRGYVRMCVNVQSNIETIKYKEGAEDVRAHLLGMASIATTPGRERGSVTPG